MNGDKNFKLTNYRVMKQQPIVVCVLRISDLRETTCSTKIVLTKGR